AKCTPLTPLRDVARSRIGLQTFAKPFYILTRIQADGWGIEEQYRMPLVFSPRDVRAPVIEDARTIEHVVFACDRPEHAIIGSAALRYIRQGMQAVVEVRGKDELVRGFHQAPRVVRAGRRPWYNLRTAIQKRGSYALLLPRRIFENYIVIHNRARVV